MTHLRTTAKLVGASLVVVGAMSISAVPSPPLDAPAWTIGTAVPQAAVVDEVVKSAEPSRPAAVVVLGGTPEQRETAHWALQRYEDAGLVVPPVEIHLHQDAAECKGNRGIYNAGSQRIDVCVDERLVVLHEIAHAWNHENLSDAQRSEYVAIGDFGSWDEPETPWFDRGSEDAADTIAWALLEEPITSASPDGPIARRNAAFVFLTGSDAPRMQVE